MRAFNRDQNFTPVKIAYSDSATRNQSAASRSQTSTFSISKVKWLLSGFYALKKYSDISFDCFENYFNFNINKMLQF